jgi:beta-lactamase superfamily II metal-dependent hydrolase
MKMIKHILFVFILLVAYTLDAQILEVKEDKSAIVKEEPTGDGAQIARLEAGTRVIQLGEVSRYYSIQLADGTTGYSYKGNYFEVPNTDTDGTLTATLTKESLLAKSDVLKIIVIDVEVGDATLIICPEENGQQDVILIDTGENDGDRIKEELINNGLKVADTPITRFFVTHYDHDHMGDVKIVAPMAETVYDLGGSIKQYPRRTSILDRRTISLNYQEEFSGGVTIECVAANNATDFDPNYQPNDDKNTNSIGLIITYNGFDYFTAGDLTFNEKPSAEKSLAKGIRNCDVYHVNHHGSRTTSSHIDFVTKLDPEVSIASNGHRHGHPSAEVAERLISIGSQFYQTNINTDERAYHPEDKYLGDNTFFEDKHDEDAEGATGSIRVVVDTDNYYVIMPRLPLTEGTFVIER